MYTGDCVANYLRSCYDLARLHLYTGIYVPEHLSAVACMMACFCVHAEKVQQAAVLRFVSCFSSTVSCILYADLDRGVSAVCGSQYAEPWFPSQTHAFAPDQESEVLITLGCIYWHASTVSTLNCIDWHALTVSATSCIYWHALTVSTTSRTHF